MITIFLIAADLKLFENDNCPGKENDDGIPQAAREAHLLALKAYTATDPKTKAKDALKVFEVPEAYNVLAMYSNVNKEKPWSSPVRGSDLLLQ